MLSEIKYALRQLAKTPGYTVIVVLTLAFGIAVNTQIFGMATELFMRPMLVREPQRLVTIVQRSDLINVPFQISFLDFLDIRSGSKALTDHIAFFTQPAHVSIPGKSPERLSVEAVTPDAFAKLAVGVVLGRPLQPSDGETSTHAPVAVLTHSFWQSHFGGDPAVIGRVVLINSKPFTVVGVAKPNFESFTYLFTSAMFIPSGASPLLRQDAENIFKYRGYNLWRILAYQVPGATLQDANAELGVFASRFAKEFADSHRNSRFQAVMESRARPDPVMTDFGPVFLGLFAGLVCLVLFIACANVTNLMSARALSREKELVVRAALGATRGRLIRQLLTESVLLAMLAGAVGYAVATWAAPVLLSFRPSDELSMRAPAESGWQIWLFTAVISLCAGVAAGIMPALRSSRVDVNEGLKQGGTRTAGGARHGFRNLLVVGQVAMSCVVLIAAALFLRALDSVHKLDFGFRGERLALLSMDLTLQGYSEERGFRFQKDLLERVRALPGVETADFALHVPFSNNIYFRDCYPVAPTGHVQDGRMNSAGTCVTPGFTKNIGATFLAGRDLAPTDDAKAPKVAVINEAFAKAFWPGENAIGKQFRIDWDGAPLIEVVGVVATGKYIMLSEAPRPYFYLPYEQRYSMPTTLVVRTKNDPHSIVQTLRETVRTMDADLPVYSLLTMDEHMGKSAFAFLPLRIGAALASIQGTLGLVLAILGLYSVVSYDVTSRTREIGVRVALGATEGSILRFVSRAGLRLTAIGLAAGFVMAVLLSFGLSRVVVGVQTGDPVAFTLTALALVATAAIACWIPARRATRVDPVQALRAE